MTPGVPAAYLGVLMSQAVSEGFAAGAQAVRRRRGPIARASRAARAIVRAAQADPATGAWKADPRLVENDYYRLVHQPRG
jgi:hypothetical protein